MHSRDSYEITVWMMNLRTQEVKRFLKNLREPIRKSRTQDKNSFMSLFPEHKYLCLSEHTTLRCVGSYTHHCNQIPERERVKGVRTERCCPSWRGRHAAMQQKQLITAQRVLNAGAPFGFPSVPFSSSLEPQLLES